MRELRDADSGGCLICVVPLLGDAYAAAGRNAEARAAYERYLTQPWPDRAAPWPAGTWEASSDGFWRVRVMERLLALDVAAGDGAAAAARAEGIASLWAGADAELAGRVEEALRLARTAAPR